MLSAELLGLQKISSKIGQTLALLLRFANFTGNDPGFWALHL